MKKLLSIGLFLSITLSAFSQAIQLPDKNWVNNYTISSPSFHLQFEGYKEGKYTYAVYNKQPCTSDFEVRLRRDIDAGVHFTIPSGKTRHLSLEKPYENDTIWCKALTNCSETYDTCYWGATTIGALPIVFNSISAKKVSATEIKLTLNVAELYEATWYRAVISLDKGKTWVERVVFLPSNIELNQNYSVTFKYK